MSGAMLQVSDVTVVYGGVRAVDGVSISLPEGRLCGLIGPNGSGKSSLLAAISRLGQLAGGRLQLDGYDYTALPAFMAARLGISRSFQTVRLQEDLSVLENVMLGADKLRFSRPILANWLRVVRGRKEDAVSRKAALEALKLVDLAGAGNRYPATLSYGAQRRVEIARCLAGKPRLLLLDEPTAGMSRAETSEIGALLMHLRDGGLTQLLVAHDLSMIHAVTDHVFALNFGRLIAQGRSAEVANDPVVREAYIGAATLDPDADD